MTTEVFFGSRLAETDPDVLKSIEKEYGRQRDQIELIASENMVSKAVIDALGKPKLPEVFDQLRNSTLLSETS